MFRQIIEYVRSRIFVKVYVSIMLFVIIILILISVMTTSMISNTLMQKEIDSTKVVLVNINNYMQTKLGNIRKILISLNNIENLGRDKLFDFLETAEYDPENYMNYIDEYNNFTSIINSLYLNDSDITAITVYKKADNTVYEFSRYGAMKSYTLTDDNNILARHFQDLSQDIEPVAASYNPTTKTYNYTLIVNFKNTYTFHNIATLAFEMNTDKLSSLVQSYMNNGVSSDFFVMSPEGGVLFAYQDRYYLQPPSFISGDSYTDVLPEVYSDSGPGFINSFSDNEANLTISAVSLEKDVAKSSQKINRIIILACVLALLITPVFIFFVSRIFSNRIRIVTNSLAKMRSGNISERIPVKSAKDEVSEISVSINQMCADLEMFIEKEYVHELQKKTIELQLKKSELKALQAFITPHFLNNTLEAIRIKANLNGAHEAGEMIMILSKLLRSTIKSSPIVTIDTEIQNAQLYLSLFDLRYKNLTYEFDIPAEILNYGIISNIIQPLIENFIMHGYIAGRENVVEIHGCLQPPYIFLAVTDNGRGIPADKLLEINRFNSNITEHESDSMGVRNVHDRIKLVFGSDCGLSITSIPDYCTTVTVKILAKSVKELKEYVQSSDR